MAIKNLNQVYNSKKINPKIVRDLILKNIKEQNSKYNAFISLSENSIKSAEDSSKRFQDGKSKGFLDGVPIVVKDNFCVKNELTTCGSKMLNDFKPSYSATAVQKLLNNGAILIGKTNMDEFAMGCGNLNEQYGQMENPWRDKYDEICVTGGSSGGTAVSIAAGWALAGLGTDTGGSVRLPATLTGLVGLKPSYGNISRHGVISLVNALDTVSVVARTVDDCALVYDSIKGKDILDSTSNDVTETSQELKSPKQLTIGIPKEYYPEGMDHEIVEEWEKTADMLSLAGYNVVKVSLPHTNLAGKCYSVLCCTEVASNMARYDGIRYGYQASLSDDDKNKVSFDEMLALTRSEGLGAAVRERILMGNFFMLKKNRDSYLDQARRIWRLICQDFSDVFAKDKVHLLLTPSAMETAPSIKQFTVFDNRLAMIRGDICTQPSSLAGVPAITLPVALSQARAMPIGLQLIGPRNKETLLLDVARVIEKWADFQHKHPFVFDALVKQSINQE